MIEITEYARNKYLDLMLGEMYEIHLLGESGELTRKDYAHKGLYPKLWKDGRYPRQVWKFNDKGGGNVEGYYVTDSQGVKLFSEDFDKPYEIWEEGGLVGITLDLSLIGGGEKT